MSSMPASSPRRSTSSITRSPGTVPYGPMRSSWVPSVRPSCSRKRSMKRGRPTSFSPSSPRARSTSRPPPLKATRRKRSRARAAGVSREGPSARYPVAPPSKAAAVGRAAAAAVAADAAKPANQPRDDGVVMKNARKASGSGGSSPEEVVERQAAQRGDVAPVEQDDDLGAEESIRARAYELYLQRGGDGAGDDMNDWLQAEREYRERRGLSDTQEIREQPGS